MFYLLHGSTHGCVDFEVLIGIASYKQEVFQLLWNFYKCNTVLYPGTTFEEWHNDNVLIYKITEDEYNWVKQEISNARSKIKKYLSSIPYEPEVVDFVFAVLNCDGPSYDIFDKEFHKKYNRLCKKTKLILK